MLDSSAPGAGGKGGLGTSSCSRFPLLPGHRYAIDRSTDAERIFDIDAKTGAIVTGKVLDRETAGWHNITVLAMEAGEMEECCVEQSLCKLDWGRRRNMDAVIAGVAKT